MQNRTLEIHDYTAGKYFRRLESLLGSENIDKRLEKVDLELRSESGAYLNFYVLPRMAWWLGFREARNIIKSNRSFRRSLTRLIEPPLQTAVKLSVLYSTMPEWKREEFSARILGNDDLEPTLYEIDSAAHYWQLGFNIEWLENLSTDGKKTPEFIARKDDFEFELECKTKKADSGRKIQRATFFRVIDNLLPVIQDAGLTGYISLTIPSRLPRQNSWHEETKSILAKNIAVGSGSIEFPANATLNYELMPTDETEHRIDDLVEKYGISTDPYAHYGMMGLRKGDIIINPVFFHLESQKSDEFLKNVFSSLREAQMQFSGERAAVISCMLPEVDSFDGLQRDSAIQKMTYYFFDKYASDFVNVVSYVSNPIRDYDGLVILSDRPSLSFRNHKYNYERFGPDIPVYE